MSLFFFWILFLIGDGWSYSHVLWKKETTVTRPFKWIYIIPGGGYIALYIFYRKGHLEL